jgi:uncharacterized RDD family membrane protein YckC
MKCPKCGYLGFERADRCRNCGYDFSLSAAPADRFDPELRIRSEPAGIDPLPPLSEVALLRDRPAPEEQPAAVMPQGRSAATRPGRTPPDLPLFSSRVPDDEPLITKPSPPRPPLAVRRATPEIRRARTEQPRVPSLDPRLDLADISGRSDDALESAARGLPRLADDRDDTRDAAVAARFVAVVIDLLILAAIDAVVIYFTLQICGITVDELAILPKVPLIAFLLVQNGGYLVAFTAGGQTLGKMAVDIRVVAADSDGTLDLGRASLRTLLWVLLAVPAGLGFLTTVFSRDRRGLHDRFAGTRVVRASA